MTSLVRSLICIILLTGIFCGQVYGQKSVGIGTTNPNPNSIMDLSTTDKGFLLPRMSTSQRNAIPTGATEEGMLVYDNTNDKFYYWDASQSQWVAIPGTNTDEQDLLNTTNFSSGTNELAIDIENGQDQTVDLSSLDDSGTDDQNIQGSGYSSATNNLTIDIENGSGETVDLSALDQPNTDNQNLFQNIENSSGVLQFSASSPTDNLQFEGTGGASVNFNSSANRVTIDASGAGSAQDLGYNNQNAPTSDFVTHEVTISGGANTNIRDYYEPDTDDQDIQGSGLSGNTLTIGIQNGSNQTVNLSSIDSDDQDLGSSVSGTDRTITITNGNNTTIDVADNDNDPTNEYQDLSGSTSGNTATVSIGNGSNASFSIADNDADPTNEYNDNLTLNGTDLELTDGGGTETADLSSLGGSNYWDRDAGSNELYPSNLNDQVGVGTSFPNEDFEVTDADGDGDATLEIGTVEEVIDGGANLLEVPSSDLLVSGSTNNFGIGNVDNDYRLYVGQNSAQNAYFDVGDNQVDDIVIDRFGLGEGAIRPQDDIWGFVGTSDSAFWQMHAYSFNTASVRKKKKDIHTLKGKDYSSVMNDIANMEIAFYRYNIETKTIDEDKPAKYRPTPRIGTFTDASPDYVQNNSYNAIDLYSFSALSMAGVKYLNKETKELKKQVRKLQTTVEDFGTSKIKNNQEVRVQYSTSFASKLQAQNGSEPVINLTPRTANAGLYIKEKDKTGFTIATSNKAKNASFDWVAKAKVEAPKDRSKSADSDLDKKLNLNLTKEEKSRLKEYTEANRNDKSGEIDQQSPSKGELSKKQEIKLEMKRAKDSGDQDSYRDLEDDLQELDEK